MGNVKTTLKYHRENAGLTQKELAEKVGVRRETIVHLEANRYNPSLILALEICRVLEKKIEDVFSLE